MAKHGVLTPAVTGPLFGLARTLCCVTRECCGLVLKSRSLRLSEIRRSWPCAARVLSRRDDNEISNRFKALLICSALVVAGRWNTAWKVFSNVNAMFLLWENRRSSAGSMNAGDFRPDLRGPKPKTTDVGHARRASVGWSAATAEFAARVPPMSPSSTQVDGANTVC